MFGYTCNEIIFVHCPDDFASPPVSLHASVSTRVWNSIWKAAVQWNCYFNILLKFYGRFSSTPSKANCFTCFGIYFFQRKNDYTKNCLEIEVPLEIQFLYLVFTQEPAVTFLSWPNFMHIVIIKPAKHTEPQPGMCSSL